MNKKIFLYFMFVFMVCPWCLSPSGQIKGFQDSAKVFDRSTVYTSKGEQIIHYRDSYALIIGIWRYTNGWPPFKEQNIKNDVNRVEESLKQHGFKVTKIFNPDANKMKQAIENFKNSFGFNQGNRLLFYFAAHGASTDNHTKGYILPTDTPLLNQKNEEEFFKKAIHLEELKADAKLMRAKHILFVFDSCFSGTIMKTRSKIKLEKMLESKMANFARQFISAGKADQTVPEVSIFTPAFSRGINGDADYNGDFYVTGKELYTYVKEEVEAFDEGQNPQFGSLKISRYEGDIIFILEEKIKEQLAIIKKNAANTENILGNPAVNIEDKIIGIKDFLNDNNVDIPGVRDDEIRARFIQVALDLQARLKEYRRFYDLAKREFDGGNFQAALEHIKSARALNNTNETKTLEELIQLKLKQGEALALNQNLIEADTSFNNKNYQRAIELYKKVLQKIPDNQYIINRINECQSRLTGSPEPSLPERVDDLDVKDIYSDERKRQTLREKERAEWEGWQTQFNANFETSKEVDRNEAISPASKVEMWENLSERFNQDNPYSQQDEEIKAYIKERIGFWNKDFGYLEVSAYPFADLTIDGESIGEVPPLRTIKLYKGEHVITLNKGNETITQKIDIEAGKRVTFSHKFIRQRSPKKEER
jgi:tetratricopeptide (TPR) repeat protein